MTRRPRSLRGRLRRVPPLVGLVRLVRDLATPLGRGRLAAARRGANLYQPATVTRWDRHPALFTAVADRLRDVPAPRLLSFGCSTGEEAISLARMLPAARVDAIDANPACVARARREAGGASEGSRLRFLCADTPDAFGGDAYDAVFCLSVLRHGDLEAWMPHYAGDLMPFSRFADAVAALDACVRPGGLLVLWGCHFRFADTPTAEGYRTLPTPNVVPQSGPFWGPDDRLLDGSACRAFVFVKRG